MITIERFIEFYGIIEHKWFGVWDVQDYYTTLEKRAQAGAEITFGYVLMVMASAVLATGGLLINSTAVIIGSMCIAPFLGPARAVCIGGLFRNRRIFLGGLSKQLIGLLIIGVGLAYAITALLLVNLPGLVITPEILLRAMPNTRVAVLSVLIAVSSGAAASLALTSDPRIVETPWGQIIDAAIGVEIAISLIPPASVIGIGLAFGRLDISWHAFQLLIINVLGLDIVGSMLILLLRGIRSKYLILEKTIRHTVDNTLDKVSCGKMAIDGVNVILLSSTAARVLVKLQFSVNETVPATLAQFINAEIKDKTGCRSEVRVEIIPCQRYTNLL